MSAHKHKEHLEKIKEAVKTSDVLNEAQKSDSVKRIEEWYEEDKAFGLLKEELLEISEYFETLFAELGLSK
jgi:regulator of protease activity HflC (stomatin/prohibitin superfamily)